MLMNNTMKNLIVPCTDAYNDYLHDESALYGSASSISFPQTENEVVMIMQALQGKPITIQGARTGLSGGCVPEQGHILNLSHMCHFIGASYSKEGIPLITVESGMTLENLRKYIRSSFRDNTYFWPVSPSEATATIGGIASTNAEGMNGCHYGPARTHIEGLHFVDSFGQLHILNRTQNSHALDAILGSEGIAGPITQLTLQLQPEPSAVWGIAMFFPDEKKAAGFGEKIRNLFFNNYTECAKNTGSSGKSWISGLEFMDRSTLVLLTRRKADLPSIAAVPDIPEFTQAMIYLEIEGASDDDIMDILERCVQIAEKYDSDPDSSWAFTGPVEVAKLHAFRHAAPEICNIIVQENQRKAPSITKCASDCSIPSAHFDTLLKIYRDKISAEHIPACVFGHIADCHLHVNFFPVSEEEYRSARKILEEWSSLAELHSGNPVKEHGIGKLKQGIISQSFLTKQRQKYQTIKQQFDPDLCINPGDIYQASKEVFHNEQ